MFVNHLGGEILGLEGALAPGQALAFGRVYGTNDVIEAWGVRLWLVTGTAGRRLYFDSLDRNYGGGVAWGLHAPDNSQIDVAGLATDMETLSMARDTPRMM